MRKIIIAAITVIAGASALATAVMVPLVYIAHWDTVTEPLYNTTISLVAWGFPFALLYALSNATSGIADQDDAGLYWADHVPSLVAWVSLNGTALIVLFELFQRNADIVRIFKESSALQLLLGLVAFSWVDILFLQKKKGAMLRAQLQNPQAAAPQLATYQQQGGAGAVALGVIFALLLGGGLLFGTIYAYTTPAEKVKVVEKKPVPEVNQSPIRTVTGEVHSARLGNGIIAQTKEHPFADVPAARQYRCAPNAAGVLVEVPRNAPGGWCTDD